MFLAPNLQFPGQPTGFPWEINCPESAKIMTSAPLFKTEFANLPVSIPEPWKKFFDRIAANLGVSRNTAVCLALKLGGPMLQTHVVMMGEMLRAECERISKEKGISKILGVAPGEPAAEFPGHDRRQNDPDNPHGSPGKPQGGQGGH